MFFREQSLTEGCSDSIWRHTSSQEDILFSPLNRFSWDAVGRLVKNIVDCWTRLVAPNQEIFFLWFPPAVQRLISNLKLMSACNVACNVCESTVCPSSSRSVWAGNVQWSAIDTRALILHLVANERKASWRARNTADRSGPQVIKLFFTWTNCE